MNICQIQIQPVDNGFVVQAVNIDGQSYSVKLIAQDVAGLHTLIHKVADQLFQPRPAQEGPPPNPPTPPVRPK